MPPISSILPDLSSCHQKFKCVVADPPWDYSSPRAVVGNGGRGSQNGRAAEIIQADVGSHYPTLTLEDLKALPVANLSDTPAHLYLWTTNAFMVEAHELCRSWGFKQKTIITWGKVKEDGTASMKTGYYFRGATEHCLFCVRGSMRLKVDARPTLYLSRRLAHSVKPDWFYKLCEECSPGPRLEMFARKTRPRWMSWGNEITSRQQVQGS